MDFSREFPEVKSGSEKKRALSRDSTGSRLVTWCPNSLSLPLFTFRDSTHANYSYRHSIGEDKLYSN
jgi:hypothetical protein